MTETEEEVHPERALGRLEGLVSGLDIIEELHAFGHSDVRGAARRMRERTLELIEENNGQRG